MAVARGRWGRAGVVLALSVLAYVLVASAWQCDDAWITFRTARNAWQGQGLTWNPGERVQAYTHPLWLLLAILAHAVSGEFFYSMSLVSIALSLATAAGIVLLLAGRPWLAAGAVLALAGSRSFVDFGTSGLENPLLGLLLVRGALLHRREAGPRRDLALTLVVSLAGLTRLDALLLVLPAWARATLRRRPAVRPLALGLLPLGAWELFSLAYYGSLLPNTALAKLNLDLPLSRLLRHGLLYLSDSLAADPVTLLATAAGSTLALARGDARARCLALGTLLYLAYVVRIGGDFMSGRFLSAPLVLSLCAAAGVLSPGGAGPGRPMAPALAVGVALYLALWPGSPLRTGPSHGVGLTWSQIVRPSGIADERAYYYPTTGLVRVFLHREELRRRGLPVPPYRGALRGVAFSRAPARVTVFDEIGFFGYFAGDKDVVDAWALCDPLLARIPYRPDARFRIGHYPRPIPAGYLESRATGENRIVEPRLREAYEAIRLVTRGPLWTAARWRAVWDLGMGRHAGAFAAAAAPGAGP